MTATPRPSGRTAATLATFASLVGSGAASWALLRFGRRLPPRVRDPWERRNHAGAAVTLLEGPAWVAGAVTGAVTGAAVAVATSRPSDGQAGGSAGATAVVAVAAGALGALDDLAGGAADKGLTGHLRALARGEVTTGAVKIVGLGAAGLVGAALVDAHGGRWSETSRTPGRPTATRLISTIVGGAVVAGAANAVNLFDLRPGRALKVTVAAGLPMLGGVPGLPGVPGVPGGLAAAAAVGSSLGVARDDLAAASMLGDTGANAAGALLGLALVERTGPVGRTVALTVLAALTLASERVSFTKVIEGNPVLRRVDEWGRERR